MWSGKSTVVFLHGGFGTEHSAEGGQKPYEIQPDKHIDFTALTRSQERWLKTNDFGHPHYRKFTGDNACNPMLIVAMSSYGKREERSGATGRR